MVKLAALTLALTQVVSVFSSGIVRPGALYRRQDPTCPQLTPSAGGRKIAIVVDSSGSNLDTDPTNLRVTAAKAFNSLLVTKAQAQSGSQPDLVTVIDFDSSASVIYPLGDPAGATFDAIDSSGGTYIAGGIELAITELTKPGDTTAGRTGIVVLTDGEDSSVAALVTQLNTAASLGIRVSFGFLSTTPPAGANTLLAAILATGGIYTTITTAAAQQSFVSLVLANGPTGIDNGGVNGTSVLLPSLTIAGNVSSSTGPKTYKYSAIANEKLDFSVQAISGQSLDVALRDAKGATEINKTTTDAKGMAYLPYTATNAIELEILISTANTSSGLFTVGLNSSAFSGNSTGSRCGIPPPNSSTTASATPTPVQFTGAAARLAAGTPAGLVFAAVLSVTYFALASI